MGIHWLHLINRINFFLFRHVLTALSFVIILLTPPAFGAEPDLLSIINHFNADNPMTPGQSFSMEVVTLNHGTAPSTSTTMRYYRSNNETISTADTEIGTGIVPSLDPSHLFGNDASLVAPQTLGIYWIGACVDSVPGEVIVDNNCTDGHQITVDGHPDLIVISPSVSNTQVTSGQENFTISATVKNQGTADSSGTTIRFFLSTDETIDANDRRLLPNDLIDVRSLHPDRIAIKTTPTITEFIDPGAYWVGACVNTVGGELNLYNNCSIGIKIGVHAPQSDLVVSSIAAWPILVTQGQDYTIYATIKNQGTLMSDRSTLKYYKSNDSIISASDTVLATTFELFFLDPGETTDDSVVIRAPLLPGTFWIGACVDPLTSESNIYNNCSGARQIIVRKGAFPWPMFLPAILHNR